MTGYAELAEQIARAAHAGQVDKLGAPYSEHLEAVVDNVMRDPLFGHLTVAQADTAVSAAWLHDVIEDTGTTLGELGWAGIGAHILPIVARLTHRPHEPRARYYVRVSTHRIARLVKYADVLHNSDPQRLAQLDPVTRERLERKYAAALDALAYRLPVFPTR